MFWPPHTDETIKQLYLAFVENLPELTDLLLSDRWEIVSSDSGVIFYKHPETLREVVRFEYRMDILGPNREIRRMTIAEEPCLTSN